MKHALFLTALSTTLSAALTPTGSLAQTPCPGPTLTGVVHDSTGALIPGATLTLDAGGPRQSGSDGRFSLPCAAPGAHRLSVKAEGFATVELAVKTPHAIALDVTLTPAVETSIDVEADAADGPPSVNTVGPSQTLSGKQLQQLADDPDDLLRELQQMASAAGGNPASATIAVDGFQDSTQLPPKSSIAYIKVNPDLFSAEYREPPFGGGGRIEIYTKPGQKAYHGALFTTNGSPFENARDPFSTAKAAIGKQRYGFEFGGPIRKVGSDFFTALEYRAIDNFAVVNAVGLEGPVSANVFTPQRLWLPNVRVDWQLNPKNTLIVGYTGTFSSLLNLGVGGTALAENGHDSQVYDQTVRVTDVTTVSTHLMHEARASLRFFGAHDTPASNAPQVQVAGAFTGGGASTGNLRYNRMRLEVDDDFILTTGHHTVKAGIQFYFNDDHRTLTNNFNGTYLFGGGAAPVLDANNRPIAGQSTTISGLEQYRRAQLNLAGGTPTAFTGVTGSPQVDFLEVNNAFFVQDDWKLPHGVMISSGLRYYLQNRPLISDGATPRVGIQWAPGGREGKDPMWTLHAHAGLFVSGLNPNTYAEVMREDGVNRITSTVYNPVFGAPFSSGATPIYSARRFAGKLSNTFYSTFNFGGTRTLGHGFGLSADVGSGRLWNYVRSNNVNAPFTDSPFGARPLVPNLNLLEVQNSGQGRFDFEFLGIENQKLKRLQFFAGAVRVAQVDDTDDDPFFAPQNARSDAGEFARRGTEATWQAFGNFTLKLPRQVQFSGNFYSTGDQHYNITTGFDNNGDGDFNDRPQYAPPGAQAGVNGAVATRFGLLVPSGGVGVFGRNRGVMPWTAHLDANLQRAFKLTRNAKAEHQQTVTANLRSSNLINHTNVTAVGGVLGSPLFGVPYAADNGRRVEAGLRYSF